MRVGRSLQRRLAVLDFLAESGDAVRTSDVAVRFDNAPRLLNNLTRLDDLGRLVQDRTGELSTARAA